jgi:hypothetical protein
MLLKNSKFLKFFAILLFSIELMAPVFLYSPGEKLDIEATQKTLHDSAHQFNLLTFLLCEEVGNEEEREGKDHKACFFALEVSSVEFFIQSETFEVLTPRTDPSDWVASQPSLITLLGTYRI